MPTRLITIPFALGQDEATAPRELPMGPLREVLNIRQRRGSAFGVRADYPAVAMTEFSGSTLVPYDLYALNGRLFALGNRQSLLVPAPTDVFEYVQQPAGNWKGTLAPTDSGTRVPPVTDVRNVGRPPDGISDVYTARVAALNGYVCLVYGFGGGAPGQTNYVHIFRADTDATIVFQPILATNSRVVVAGGSFWVLGVDASSDLAGFRFNTLSDNDLQAPVTLYAGTVTSSIFAATTVDALTQAQFAFIVRDGSTTVVRRFNEAGSQQDTFAGPAVAATTLAIEADSVANQIMVAYRVAAADAFAQTYNLATHASVSGPTAMFGETVTGDLSLNRTGLGVNIGELVTEDSSLRLIRNRFTPSSLPGGTLLSVHNYILGGRGAQSPLGIVQPVISDDTGQLLVYDLLSATRAYSAAALDTRISQDGDPGTDAAMGGELTRDAVSGKYYWARLIAGTDGQRIPVVSEFRLGSTDRRQSCQIGGELFIAGGLPLVFDARQVVENGFTERPVFNGALAGTTGGSLIPGAEYDYCAIYRWTDSQNLEAKSAVSDIETITLGAAQNAVQANIFGPHTLRRDTNTGSAASISLYRTDAAVTQEAATLIGRNGIDPPSSSLNGLTLNIFYSPAGLPATLFAVVFDAGSVDTDAVVIDVNTVTAGSITASNGGGALQLTANTTGEGTEIWIYPGTANTILGFVDNENAEGSTTFTKGSVFHLTVTFPALPTNELGASVLMTDGVSDAVLLTRETLYTQGERGALTGILEHEAAPACKYCWPVGARVFLGGLPDPSEVAISKELFPAEAIAFSSNFAFRANVDGVVTAVAGLDGVPIAFTADAIYRFQSQLPNDQGADGELGPPVRVPSEGGCSNANSILETSLGLFYQARDTKLMLLPRGNASPVWLGKAVQDTLTLFPVITSAAFVDEDHCAVFTCKSVAGTSSTILVFDLRIGQWYRDTFASAQVIRAGVDYLGRLAYIDTAVVRLQSASLTPAAFIEYSSKSGSLRPFDGGKGGWGKLVSITVEGEFRGNCQMRCRISYDDGVTFTNLKTFTYVTPTFAVGQSIVEAWWPSIRKGSDFVLDFQVLTNGTPSEGLILNSYTLEVDGAVPVKRIRTSQAERG